jgi:hypothetical protein
MATPFKYWLNIIKKAICISPSWGHAIMPEKPLLYNARPCRNKGGCQSMNPKGLNDTEATHGNKRKKGSISHCCTAQGPAGTQGSQCALALLNYKLQVLRIRSKAVACLSLCSSVRKVRKGVNFLDHLVLRVAKAYTCMLRVEGIVEQAHVSSHAIRTDKQGQPHPSMTTPPVREHWEHWTAESTRLYQASQHHEQAASYRASNTSI